MGCLLLPFRLILLAQKIGEWVEKVNNETEIIRETYGIEVARKYKHRRYMGCIFYNLLWLVGLAIIGLIASLFI